ncbi:hypothetical protein N7509_009951 [Penicillium cosmopolitanum]|uniref:Uncharacterized protein n=1 Tax=Penicillium cosmopolitanum TaxID=1131564 RepID=A0A9X0B458_9EURO|nr:uncharacterized protein N7509_009951 [Penicillium cosmopolitanum]KAJ5387410.1 hypothetical protein N7509_009951 [Penicillium cosmopolitanum]
MSDSVTPVSKNASDHIERTSTDGGHLDHNPCPNVPVVKHTFANTAPLGLLSFATELITGNTFGGTLFCAYAAFNFAYAMIFLPGTGIIAAYTDPTTGEISGEFEQAVGVFLLAWFILTVIMSIGAMRSSWVLFVALVFLSLCLLLLAVGNMTGNTAALKAGDSFGLIVAFLTYWAGAAGLWAGNTTAINLPTFEMYKGGQAA